jgi:hypothetical protein
VMRLTMRRVVTTKKMGTWKKKTRNKKMKK